MHKFIKIFKKFQEIGPVSQFFRIWTSATPRPIPNAIWKSTQFGHFHIFRFWSSAQPRPMLNVILQSLVNVKSIGYAIIYQNIPKVQGIGPVSLFFSKFETRRNVDPSQISFDTLTGYILSISMCIQNFITIFFTTLEIEPFSLFQDLELGKASTDKKYQFAIS